MKRPKIDKQPKQKWNREKIEESGKDLPLFLSLSNSLTFSTVKNRALFSGIDFRLDSRLISLFFSFTFSLLLLLLLSFSLTEFLLIFVVLPITVYARQLSIFLSPFPLFRFLLSIFLSFRKFNLRQNCVLPESSPESR